MEYKLIAQTSELPNGNKKKILYDNREILIVNVEGSFYAVDNKCPHMGGSLYDGDLDGYSIVCPRHGSGFDVRTGKVTQTGKMLYIKVKPKDLHTYPVKIEGTNIFIGIE
jgi:3-phenylpropionate/trans-cinnamate dioxygenase ferredoxin component